MKVATTERQKGALEHLRAKLVSARQVAAQAEHDLKSYLTQLLAGQGQNTDGMVWDITSDFDLESVGPNGLQPPPMNQKQRRSKDDKAEGVES